MASLDQISQALLNADAAGDVEAATALAQEYRRQSQRPQETPGYLSQLGTALSIGGRQMASGVKATFNAATGDVADTAEAMAQMGGLQREQEAAQTPEDVALSRDYAQNKAEWKAAQGFLPSLGALGGYLSSTAAHPGAVFKQAIQSAPNAAIGIGTQAIGSVIGGALGAGAGAELGPGAIATGIAGAAAGGAVSNTLMEAGPAIYDILNERTNGAAANMDAQQIAQYLRQNPDIMSEGLKTGAIRGSVIGVIEGLGMKGAGALLSIPERAAARAVQKTLVGAGVDVASKEAIEKALLDPALKNAVSTAAKAAKDQFSTAGNLARGAGATAIETGAAGAGELGAQVAAGQEIDPTEIVAEMTGEVGMNAASVPLVKAIEAKKYLAPQVQEATVTAANSVQEAAASGVPMDATAKALADIEAQDTSAFDFAENLRRTQEEGAAVDIQAAQMRAQEEAAAAQAAVERQAQFDNLTPNEPITPAPVGNPLSEVGTTENLEAGSGDSSILNPIGDSGTVPTQARINEAESPPSEIVVSPATVEPTNEESLSVENAPRITGFAPIREPKRIEIAEEDKAEVAELESLMERKNQAAIKTKGVKFTKKDEARFQELGAKHRRYYFESVDPKNDPIVGEDNNNQPIRQSKQGTFYTVENGKIRTGPAFKNDPEYVREQNELLKQQKKPITPPAETPTNATEGKTKPMSGDSGSSVAVRVFKPKEQQSPDEYLADYSYEIALARAEKDYSGKSLKALKKEGRSKYDARTRQNLKQSHVDTILMASGQDEKLNAEFAKYGQAVPREPVSAAAVDTYGIKLPEGYVRDGELYVYRPQSTEKAEKPSATQEIITRLNSASSREEAREILSGVKDLLALKEVAKAMGYPTTGTKKDVVNHLVAAVGSRADGKAIRGDNPRILNTPTIVRTPEQQAVFDEERRIENERAKELDVNIPKKKPRTAEEFARDMEAIMAPSQGEAPSAKVAPFTPEYLAQVKSAQMQYIEPENSDIRQRFESAAGRKMTADEIFDTAVAIANEIREKGGNLHIQDVLDSATDTQIKRNLKGTEEVKSSLLSNLIDRFRPLPPKGDIFGRLARDAQRKPLATQSERQRAINELTEDVKRQIGNDPAEIQRFNELLGLPKTNKSIPRIATALLEQADALVSEQPATMEEAFGQDMSELQVGDVVSWEDKDGKIRQGAILSRKKDVYQIADKTQETTVRLPRHELTLVNDANKESRTKALDSIIGTPTGVEMNAVSPMDGQESLALVHNSGDVPGVLNAFVGTSKEFLANKQNEKDFPELYKIIKAGRVDEGNFAYGRAFVFTDGIGVNASDRANATKLGITPSVAAVRRVLIHEGLVHRGIYGLPARLQMQILQWVRQNATPQELDALAKDYPQYADWATNPQQMLGLAEEFLAKKVEKMTKFPTSGPLARLVEILKDVWRYITGKDGEPTVQNLRDVVKLLKAGAKAANQRLVNGGGIKMSQLRAQGFVTPEMDAEYAKAVADGDVAKQQKMVDAAAKAAGTPQSEDGYAVVGEASGLYTKNSGEHVIAAAVFHPASRTLFLGDDHGQAQYLAFKREIGVASVENGFFTSAGRFVDAGEAIQIARDSKQHVARRGDGHLDSFALKESMESNLDPITRDDNGQVIPLSQRFNAAKADIRESRISYTNPLDAQLASASERMRQMREKVVPQGVDSAQVRAEIRKAYDASIQGSGSVQVSLQQVYDIAKQAIPTLTEKQFGEQVQALYEDGSAFLVPTDRSADMLAAGEKWGVYDVAGLPASYIGVMPSQETNYENDIRANTTSLRPRGTMEPRGGAEEYGTTTPQLSPKDKSPRANTLRAVVDERVWRNLSPDQKKNALDDFGAKRLEGIAANSKLVSSSYRIARAPSDHAFAALLPETNAERLVVEINPSIDPKHPILQKSALEAHAFMYDMMQEEMIHFAQHYNAWQQWVKSGAKGSVVAFENKHFNDQINELMAQRNAAIQNGDSNAARKIDTALIHAWNFYDPSRQVSTLEQLGRALVDAKVRMPEFMMEVTRQLVQIGRQDFTTETGWAKFRDMLVKWANDVLNSLRNTLASVRSGEFGQLLKDEIANIERIVNQIETGDGVLPTQESPIVKATPIDQNALKSIIDKAASTPISDDSIKSFYEVLLRTLGVGGKNNRDLHPGVRMARFSPSSPLQVMPHENGELVMGLGEGQARQIIRDSGSSEAGFRYIADAIEEEIIHLADYLAIRSKWESQGSKGNFIVFAQRETQRLTKDLQDVAKTLSDSDKEALRKTLGATVASYHDKSEIANASLEQLIQLSANTSAPMFAHSELIRALIQAKRSGEITATGYKRIANTLVKWLQDALNWLKQAYGQSRSGGFGNVLAQRIQDTEQQLEMLGVMPTEIKASVAAGGEIPKAIASTKGFADAIDAIKTASPTLVESEARALKDHLPDDHIQQGVEPRVAVSIALIDRLLKSGIPAIELPSILNSPAFLESLGIEQNADMQQYLSIEALNRINQAAVDTDNISDRNNLVKQADGAAKIWNLLGEFGGRSLGTRGWLMKHPRYAAMFVEQGILSNLANQSENVTKANVVDPSAVVKGVEKAGETANEAATNQADQDLVESWMEAAEETLSPKAKGLFDRIREKLARIGYLMGLNTNTKQSVAGNLAARFAQEYKGITKEKIESELAKLRKEVEADLSSFADELLGKDAPQEAKTKVKKTAEKAAKREKKAKPTAEDKAKKKQERANAVAQRLIYRTEEVFRQGFKNESKSVNADSILKAFRDQVKEPVSDAAFTARVKKLNVTEEVAARMLKTASRERGDQEQIKKNALLDSVEALKKIMHKLSGKLGIFQVDPTSWRKLFSTSNASQAQRKVEMQEAIKADPAFSKLDEDEQKQLADLLDEAWQAKRDEVLKTEINRLTRTQKMSDKAKDAISEAIPEIIQMVNRGTFDNAELAKIVSSKFGFRELTAEERGRLREITEKLQQDIPPWEHKRLANELRDLLADVTKLNFAELAEAWWVSSVLSGPRTAFTIGLGFNSGGFEVIKNSLGTILLNPTNPNAWDASFKAIKGWLSSMPREAQRALAYLKSGDVTLLDSSMSNDAALIDRAVKELGSVGIAAKLLKSKNPVYRKAGQFMAFMQKLLTALDMFNGYTAKYAAMPLAYFQTQSVYDPKELDTIRNHYLARQQVLASEFGGVEPSSLEDKARLNAWATDKMWKDIQRLGTLEENANYLAQVANMTLNPTGVGGIFYHTILGIQANQKKKSADFVQKQKEELLNADGIEKEIAKFNLALGYMYQFAAHNFLGAFGLKFSRFAGAKINQTLSFIPLLGLTRLAEKTDAQKMHIANVAGAQALGFLLLGQAFWILSKIAEEPDDDERGWDIQGGWQNISPERKQQLLAAGKREYTIFYKGKRYSYANWPISGMLSAIGSMADLIRYSPDQWNEKSVANRLASGVWAAAASVGDSAALSQLSELLGTSMASRDPIEASMGKFNRVFGNYAGGFIPRILKDVDLMQNPKINTYKTLWERLAKEVPVARRYEGKALLDIFSNQVAPSRLPWSRELVLQPPELEYQKLGQWNNNGIWLSPPNAQNRMVGKGRNRRPMTEIEADRYVDIVGKGYRDMVLKYGDRVLAMPVERAKAFVSDKADEIRDRASKKAVKST